MLKLYFIVDNFQVSTVFLKVNTLGQTQSELLFKIKQLIALNDDVSENLLEYSGEFPFPPGFPSSKGFGEEILQEIRENVTKSFYNYTEDNFGSGDGNSTDDLQLITFSQSGNVLKLLLMVNETEGVKNISYEEGTNSTFNNDTIFDQLQIGDVQNATTKQPTVVYRSTRTTTNRTKVGLIIGTSGTTQDPTIELAHLKLCSINASTNDNINLSKPKLMTV